MKKRIGWALVGWAAWATAAGAFPTAIQQQGRLLDGTNLYSGTATIAYRLFAVDEGGAALAGATNEVAVVDGLYAADLDLTPAEWTAVLTNAELYLETEIDGTPLAPRERLGAVAYAQLAAGVTNGAIGELQLANDAVTEDKLAVGAVTTNKLGTGSVTADKLVADAVTEDKLAAGAVTTNKIGAGAVTESKLGSGAVTTNKIGTGAVTEKKIEDGAVSANKLAADAVDSSKILDGSITVADVATNAFWRTDGNTGIAGSKFIGTTDGTSFEIRCMNESVFRADNPFMVAGTTLRMGRSNTVDFAPGAVLGGGFLNRIEGNNYNVALGGGTHNTIEYEAQNSVLAGGVYNRIGTNAFDATLSGGSGNSIGAYAEGAVIAGGQDNVASSTNSAIGGGASNTVVGIDSVVAGGKFNDVRGRQSAIGGGQYNVVSNGAGGTVAGGSDNIVGLSQAFIGGGTGNRANSTGGVIGGGLENAVVEQLCVVAGGANNFAGGGNGWASVGGGYFNKATGSYATVAGGYGNRADWAGFVGGGEGNRIGVGAEHGVIGGGEDNTIGAGTLHSIIGGGHGNEIVSWFSFIGGGVSNTLFSPDSVIGGGWHNFCQGNFGVIAGGGSNSVDAIYGAIGGGWDNFANAAATVAGGVSNRANGIYSMIPGGLSNQTSGAYSFAAGRRALAAHDGSFVWADSTDEEFASTTNDQFSVRAANGARFVGSTNLGSLTVSPLHSTGDKDSQIYLTETEVGSYGTILKHDGGVNQFQVFGKAGTNIYGPHLVVVRNTNAFGFSLVGIGRTPLTNSLEVEGEASKTAGGSWQINSDARIKTNVRTIEGALDVLAKLRPVAFRYTAEHRAKHPSIEDRDYNNFIAQEYREVFPNAVKEDGAGLLSVDTYDVQPYLVRAAQELAAAVADLRAENADLKRRLEALEAVGH